MDTVEGVKGGKVLLTLTFRKYRMLFSFLLESKSSQCVLKVFDYLQDLYGVDLFNKLFSIILTDNGSEFSDPLSLEFDSTGKQRCHIFYCDPAASWQKGVCEKNHEFIRYVLPKGTSFDNFIQSQINLLLSHINSYSRDILNNLSPYQVFCSFEDEAILKKMGIIQVHPDNVNLKPNLLK
jgi:IS30 family transposase